MKHGLALEFLRSDEIWGGGCQKIKVAQNGVKHGLVLEFLKSNEIFEIWSEKLTGQQASQAARQHTSRHHSDQISCSALRDGATNKLYAYLNKKLFFFLNFICKIIIDNAVQQI